MSLPELETSSLWDRLMRLQTALSQPFEVPFFFNSPAWFRARRVLDIGTGNGYYLGRLARYFPDKRYVGIDTDLEHIKCARREGRTARTMEDGPTLEFAVEDALNVQGDYDAVLARLLIQHLPSVPEFLDSMRGALPPAGTLIVVESLDDVRRFVPPIPSMMKFFDVLRANRQADGCDRDAGRLLAGIAAEFGFEPLESQVVVVPSTTPGQKDLFVETYQTVLELGRSAFRVDAAYEQIGEDLRAWRASPSSYAQLGVHLASYRRR